MPRTQGYIKRERQSKYKNLPDFYFERVKTLSKQHERKKKLEKKPLDLEEIAQKEALREAMEEVIKGKIDLVDMEKAYYSKLSEWNKRRKKEKNE